MEEVKFPIFYRGISCDSDDEIYFLQWVFELIHEGFVLSVKRADSYQLSGQLLRPYTIQLKTKRKEARQKLLSAHEYSPDFDITWSPKAHNIFFQEMIDCDIPEKITCPFISNISCSTGRVYSIVEVKPNFDKHNMEREFVINRKWMWDKYNIFVNLVKYKELFPKYFTPSVFLKTRTGRDRILQWKPKSLSEYLYDRSTVQRD